MDNQSTFLKIIDNIYLTTNDSQPSLNALKSMKITHILIMGSELEILFPETFKCMKLDIEDSSEENILFNFDSVYNFIEDALLKGNILFYCNKGISRGPTFLLAYLIKKQRISFDEAYLIVSSVKPDIDLNEGFLLKLKAFDKQTNNIVEYYYKCS